MQLEGLGIDYLDHRAELISGVTLDQARAVARGSRIRRGSASLSSGTPPASSRTRPAPEKLD